MILKWKKLIIIIWKYNESKGGLIWIICEAILCNLEYRLYLGVGKVKNESSIAFRFCDRKIISWFNVIGCSYWWYQQLYLKKLRIWSICADSLYYFRRLGEYIWYSLAEMELICLMQRVKCDRKFNEQNMIQLWFYFLLDKIYEICK